MQCQLEFIYSDQLVYAPGDPENELFRVVAGRETQKAYVLEKDPRNPNLASLWCELHVRKGNLPSLDTALVVARTYRKTLWQVALELAGHQLPSTIRRMLNARKNAWGRSRSRRGNQQDWQCFPDIDWKSRDALGVVFEIDNSGALTKLPWVVFSYTTEHGRYTVSTGGFDTPTMRPYCLADMLAITSISYRAGGK